MRCVKFFIIFLILVSSNYYEAFPVSTNKDKPNIKKEKKNKVDKKIISEKIYTDKLLNTNKNEYNKSETNIVQTKDKEKINKNNLKKIISTLEKTQLSLEQIKKNIKINSEKNYSNIKKMYDLSIIEAYEIIDFNEIFFTNLNDEETLTVKDQVTIITKTIDNLKKIIKDLDNKFEDNNFQNEELFNKIKKLEKEMGILYRQYRAIEWILLEQ